MFTLIVLTALFFFFFGVGVTMVAYEWRRHTTEPHDWGQGY